MRYVIAFLLCLNTFALFAQSPEPVNGVRDPGGKIYVLRDVVVHPVSGKSFTGMVILKDKRIIAAAPDAEIPAGAIVMSLPGRHVYPGFIEAWSDVGFDKVNRRGRGDQMTRNNDGTGDWNMAIMPEYDASLHIKNEVEVLKQYRESGFTTLCSHRDDGIMQGTGILLNAAQGSMNEISVKSRAANYYSFSKGSSPMDYPSSLMGSIALFRQTMKNLAWYESGGRKEYTNRSLEALTENAMLPSFFKASSWRDVLRISSLSKEFRKPYFVLENGDSYQRVAEIKQTGLPLLVSLNFPEAWNVNDASAVEHISWSDMQHWEAAPANAAILYQAGVPFALSSFGLKSPGNFIAAAGKAVKAGLPAAAALKAITETPARWLGIWDEAGSIEAGKLANILICSDTLFGEKWEIESCFVQGQLFQIKNPLAAELPGRYELLINQKNYSTILKSDRGKYSVEISDTGKAMTVTPEIAGSRIDFVIRDKGVFNLYRFNGNISAVSGRMQISGTAYSSDGSAMPFTLNRVEDLQVPEAKKPENMPFQADDFIPRYPFNAFGSDTLPLPASVLIKGATVWTSAGNGQPFKGDILVSKGKIIAIGESIRAEDYKIKEPVRIISGEGKHVSAGIIDEHSHIAIERGVNEGSQNNTAEVRIGDAIDSEDPAIYYQLMGGVTSAQLLHGSANPIGGQSAIIKLKWGETPEGMLNKKAPGHIKFALGENVKQSNWGDNRTSRFPQTRMGVEQVYYDAFTRAAEYMAEKEKYNSSKTKNTEPFREDLEMEAICEIMKGERFITCHSYIQSEVNMLMHVADSLGFKINTFTHILEGYKVADKLAEHGANASTFSDWWAYKFEVNDAIPHNAALLTRAGVNTGINSDDAEMGRRLNQEAAKAVLYGGLSEAEALKLVTINPAKMLHIDKSTGSLEPGKDADLVIWSDHPLSVQARAELTMIDGVIYFELSEHDRKVEEIARLRAALISKLLEEKSDGSKRIVKKQRHRYHCDDLYNGDLFEEEEL